MGQDFILITGASGFIGFKTLILALEAGYHVRAIVRRSEQIPKLRDHPRIQSHSKSVQFHVIPDLTRTSSFDPVLEGVTGILHLASPLANETDDYERDIVRPATDMTTSVLEAASRSSSVKRVIIASSAVTTVPFEWLSRPDSERIYTEHDFNSNPSRPFQSSMQAYWASKAFTRIITRTFLAELQPRFEIINLLPTVVIGPDALATCTASLLTGTRALAMGPILGQTFDLPLTGVQVHVDDVAKAHVEALKPSVPGNADYILTSDGVKGIEWNSAKDTIRTGVKNAEGEFKLDGSIPTLKWRVDASSTEKAFGWKFRSFEETMKDLVDQYLELLDKERTT